MAIWQYSFFIIPSESVNDLKVTLLGRSEDDEFDDSFFWKNSKIICEYFSDINNIISKSSSWNSNIVIYGNIDSNCFEILCLEGFVASVSLRIDFTSEHEELLRNFIEFFISKGLSVLDEQLQLVPLNYYSIKNTIDNSPQVKKYIELLS